MTSELDTIRAAMRANYLPPEDEAVQRLVGQAALSADQRAKITTQAADLVRAVRASSDPRLMEVFLSAYGLSTKEGVALMCLAEALLRVPDAGTMDDLIRDKIAPHDWSAHSGGSSSIFVNASTWALMLTGKVLDEGEGGIEGTLRAMVRRLGEPVIRTAVSAAMREMGEQFVLGRTIDEAVRRGRPMTSKGYLYSYDMLGEAARTEADAIRYHHAYADAISSLNSGATGTDIRRNPGISVKLSAIHPRYEMAQKETMLPVMSERLLSLALAARACPHGAQHRRRGGRPPRPVARRHRARACRTRACRLERLWRRRAGLWAARCLRHRLALRARPAARPPDHGAPGQGRLLGYRDQAGADARPDGLSRIHTQGQHRRLLHRQRAQAAVDDRPHLSAIRHAQCTYRGGNP